MQGYTSKNSKPAVVRLTEPQRVWAEKQAESEGLTLSDYFRQVFFELGMPKPKRTKRGQQHGDR